jgi:hypothetical protein
MSNPSSHTFRAALARIDEEESQARIKASSFVSELERSSVIKSNPPPLPPVPVSLPFIWTEQRPWVNLMPPFPHEPHYPAWLEWFEAKLKISRQRVIDGAKQ